MTNTETDSTSTFDNEGSIYERVENGESPSTFKISPKRQPNRPYFRFNSSTRLCILLVSALFLAAIILGVNFGSPCHDRSEQNMQDQKSSDVYKEEDIMTTIDAWLFGEGLNGYGDDIDTTYQETLLTE